MLKFQPELGDSRFFRLAGGAFPNKFRDETILLASDFKDPPTVGWAQKPALCRTSQWNHTYVKVKLKGMCSATRIDREFVLNWKPLNNNPWDYVQWYYQGIANSSIRWLGNGNWEISDNNYWFWEKKDIETVSK